MLQFEAKVKKVHSIAAKVGQYGSTSAAKCEVTLVIDAPEMPRKPQRGHAWQDGEMERLLGGDALDSDGAEKLKQLQEEIHGLDQRHAERLREYEEAMAGLQDRMMAYAQLVGVTSLFGASRLHVTFRPAEQALLPGIDVALLPSPELNGNLATASGEVDDAPADDLDARVAAKLAEAEARLAETEEVEAA